MDTIETFRHGRYEVEIERDEEGNFWTRINYHGQLQDHLGPFTSQAQAKGAAADYATLEEEF